MGLRACGLCVRDLVVVVEHYCFHHRRPKSQVFRRRQEAGPMTKERDANALVLGASPTACNWLCVLGKRGGLPMASLAHEDVVWNPSASYLSSLARPSDH
jgi:hypothetical protein